MLTTPNGGSLDTLAKARQVLAINPGTTQALLKTFRAAHGLPALA